MISQQLTKCLLLFFGVTTTMAQKWHLYTSELIDIYPSSNWTNPEPPQIVCNSIVPPFQLFWDFTGGIWQRQFNLEPERGFARIFIKFELYVIDASDSFIIQNQFRIFFDGLMLPIEIMIKEVHNTTYCSSRVLSDKLYILEFEIDLSEKSYYTYTLELRMLDMSVKYSIKNFIVFLQKCDSHCLSCDSKFFRCQTCTQTYVTKNIGAQKCLCVIPSSFRYNDMCKNECPIGYYPDSQAICLQYQSKNSLFTFHFDQANNPSQNYLYIQDTFSNPYYLMQNYSQGFSEFAGPFRFNDKIQFSFNKQSMDTALGVELDFYFLGELSVYFYSIQVWSKLHVIINGFYFGGVLWSLVPHHGQVTNSLPCQALNFSQCVKVSYYLYIPELRSFDIMLELEGNLKQIIYIIASVSDASQAWGLDQLKVGEIAPIIVPVSLCTLQYLGECVQQCPHHSTLMNNICEDYGSIYKNPFYVLQAYHSIQLLDYISRGLMGLCERVYYNDRLILTVTNDTIKQTFKKLNPHFKLKYFISILLIDWQFTSGDDFYLQIKFPLEKIYHKFQPDFLHQINSQQIQQEFNDYLFSNFSVEFQHLNEEFQVELYCRSPYNAQCAFYDYFIIIEKCDHGCEKCDGNGICISQNNYYTIEQITYNYQNYQCLDGYFYKQELQLCLVCSPGCMKCSSEIACVSCSNDLIQIGSDCYCPLSKKQGKCELENCALECQTCKAMFTNRCNSCDIQELKIPSLNSCICINGYYLNNEKQCTNCSQGCQTCSNFQVCTSCNVQSNRELIDDLCICKSGFFEKINETGCQPCSSNCQSCFLQSDFCSSCFIQENRQLLNHKCLCSQRYYEDTNYQCQQCHPSCYSCADFWTCTSCSEFDNRVLDHSKCICNLGYFEDEQNICQSCHYSCSSCDSSNLFNKCTRCPMSRYPSNNDMDTFQCMCLKGYYDIESLQCKNCNTLQNAPISHICYSQCGDLIVQWNEENDDGNVEPRDSCNNCYYYSAACDASICKQCFQGQCKECSDGYFIGLSNTCESCSHNCITCNSHKNNCILCSFSRDDQPCFHCDEDKGYQRIDEYCFSICGDKIVVDLEECDDGNANNGDGCSSICKIEEGYICNGQCEIIQPIDLLLSVDQKDKYYDNQRHVYLNFNQEVKIDGNLTNMIIVQLVQPENYSSNSSIKTSIINQLNSTAITLEFQDSIFNPKVLIVISNPENITNSQGIHYINTNNSLIKLLSYAKQSESTIATANNTKGFANYIIYTLIGLAAISFLTGGLNIFFNLLDSLQLLAYLKYLNVQYPFNLALYFTTFGFAEFDFLKGYISVNFQWLNLDVSLQENQPDQKFADSGYTSLFIINVLSVLTVFGTTYGLYLFSQLVYKVTHNISTNISSKIEKDVYYKPKIIVFYIYECSKYIRSQCRQANKQIMNNFNLTFMTVAMDLNMAIFLQLKSYDEGTQISFYISLIFLLLELYFVFHILTIVSKPIQEAKTEACKQYYQAYSEGLQNQQNSCNKMYHVIIIMKKILFMFILVFCYAFPYLQAGAASLLAIGFIGYITFNNPLEDNNEYYKVLLSEVILWVEQLVVVLLIYLSAETGNTSIAISTSEMLGWIVIGLSSLLLISQLLIDVKQHFSYLHDQYQFFQQIVSFVQKIFKRQNIEDLGEKQSLFESLNQSTMQQQKQNSKIFTLSRRYY